VSCRRRRSKAEAIRDLDPGQREENGDYRFVMDGVAVDERQLSPNVDQPVTGSPDAVNIETTQIGSSSAAGIREGRREGADLLRLGGSGAGRGVVQRADDHDDDGQVIGRVVRSGRALWFQAGIWPDPRARCVLSLSRPPDLAAAIHHRDQRLFTAGGEGREERDSHG
jgi:hypothetical protein